MPILAISVLLQVLLVLHVVKTGRNTTWIWIIVMLPPAGAIAYLVVEVLPDLTHSRTGRRTTKKVLEVLNPDRDINRAAADYSVTETIDNTMKLASECINKEMYAEARELYKKCLVGVHEHDPDIMHGLAQSEYGLQNYSETKQLLDELIKLNPAYKNQEAHLLYAKNLEQLGEHKQALEEYEILDSYYLGPEPTYRLGMLLKKQGQEQKAMELFRKIIHKSDISGGHYRSLHKTWIKLARSEYRG